MNLVVSRIQTWEDADTFSAAVATMDTAGRLGDNEVAVWACRPDRLNDCRADLDRQGWRNLFWIDGINDRLNQTAMRHPCNANVHIWIWDKRVEG